jgi:hypothetical protein
VEEESAGKVRVESMCPDAHWHVVRGTAPVHHHEAA